MHGERDAIAPPANAWLLAELIPDAEWAICQAAATPTGWSARSSPWR